MGIKRQSVEARMSTTADLGDGQSLSSTPTFYSPTLSLSVQVSVTCIAAQPSGDHLNWQTKEQLLTGAAFRISATM
ncbi:hypothetical protein J6590_026495 [Homalodisca vitripennis]|nr:hypothetical protein J6590_026495 [Homalodisca vitripennis]